MGRAAPLGASPGQPYLLLLGDQPEFTYLFERYAQHSGYNFRSVARAEDALALAEQRLPAAIIIDGALAHRQDGLALRRLHDDPLAGPVPRLVCSVCDGIAADLGLLADLCLTTPIIYPQFLHALITLGLKEL